MAFALHPCGKPIVANSERRKKHDNKVASPKNAKKHNNKGFQPLVLTAQRKAHNGLKPVVIKKVNEFLLDYSLKAGFSLGLRPRNDE